MHTDCPDRNVPSGHYPPSAAILHLDDIKRGISGDIMLVQPSLEDR